MAGPQSLAVFEGKWHLEREIQDAKAGIMILTGRCEFKRASQRLTYEETGTLVIPGQAPMQATRRYLWGEKNGWIEIRFGDGRAFHRFPLNVTEPTASHSCMPDRYEVSYDFRSFPEWSSTWKVSGPRKDYRMLSVYRR